MTEQVSDNEVRVEKKTRQKKIVSPKKASPSKRRTNPHSPVSPKRIKRKREIDEASQIEKPTKKVVIHLMIYPVPAILL